MKIFCTFFLSIIALCLQAQQRFETSKLEYAWRHDYLFDNVTNFNSQNRAFVKIADHWGMVDTAGTWLIRPEESGWTQLKEPDSLGWRIVQVDTLWGTMNELGQLTMDPSWLEISKVGFKEGLVGVKNNKGLWGFVDRVGTQVIECKYKNVGAFSSAGLASVCCTDGRYGFIDKTGKEIVPCKYQFVGDFNEGLAIVSNSNNLYGFIDKTGKEAIPCSYSLVNRFNEGLAIIQKKDGTWGFIDAAGHETLLNQYSNIRMFNDGLALVTNKQNKMGYIDRTGREIVPCQFKWGMDFKYGLAFVQDTTQLFLVINKKGKGVIPPSTVKPIITEQGIISNKDGDYGLWSIKNKNWTIFPRFDNLRDYSEGIWVFKRTSKYGYCDSMGVILRPAEFDNALPFFQARAGVEKQGKWGFIDIDGKELFASTYSELHPLNQRIIRVKNLSGGFGIIDKTNKELLPCTYKKIDEFSEDFALAQNGDSRWGFIDKSGAEAIACTYKKALDFCEGLAVVQSINGKYGFIDKTGNEIMACQYKNASPFREGMASVQSPDGKWGFVDKTGAEAIYCQYPHVGYFREGLASVQNTDGKWGFVDKTGREIIACEYAWGTECSEGMIGVQDLYKNYGFLDKKGKVVVDFIYSEIMSFNGGVAAVKNTEGKWGFIDKTGKEVVACQYASVSSFVNGIAIVTDKWGRSGLINKKGEMVLEPQHKTNFDSQKHGVIKVSQNGKWGIVNTDGNWVLQPQYDAIKDWSDGLAAVRQGQLWGFVDTMGRVLVEPQFTKVDNFNQGLAYVEKQGFQALLKRPKVVVTAGEAGNWVMGWTLPKICFSNCTVLDYYDDVVAIQLHIEAPTKIDSSNCKFKLRLRNSRGQDVLIQEDGSKSNRAKLRIPNKTEEKEHFDFDYENELVLKGVPAGNYSLQVIIEHEGRIQESVPMPISYQPRQPSLHLLSVGVPEGLRFSTNDAADFANAVSHNTYYQKNHVYLLPKPGTEDKGEIAVATGKEGIKSKLRLFVKQYARNEIKEHDVIMIFISAHGDVIENQSSTDFCIRTYGYDSEDKETGLRVREIMEMLAPINCKKILFLDACHSGLAQTKGADEKAQALSISRLNDWKSGWVVFTSSGGEESFEHESWGNGAFTESIIEAVSGKADVVETNGFISIEELDKYIKKRVPELINALGKDYRPQQPQLFLPDNSSFNIKADIFQVKK